MSKEQQAQMDAMMKAMTPGAPHKLLGELAGEWTFTNKMWMDPSAPPTESTGSASYRLIMGGRYLQMEQRGMFAGMPFEGVGTMAFDNVTQKYYLSWIDNMSTGLFVSTGPTTQRSGPPTLRHGRPMRRHQAQGPRVITVIDSNTAWTGAGGGWQRRR
jgi:hypothetical protein